MQLQINRQNIIILIDLVKKDLLEKRQEVKRHEKSFFEYKNGSYMDGLRTEIELLKKILQRLENTNLYSKSSK